MVRIVRYRPQLRCTLQVGNGRGEPYSFAKVLPDDHGGAIHEAGVLLWNAVVRGELGFHVAEPQRWDAGKRCLWHAEVPGESAQSRLFNAEGARIAHRMGRALATLSNSSVRFDAVFDAAWQLERTTGYLRELAARLPQESMTIDALVLELERLHTRLEPAPLRPLHGAPHPHQWLIADNTFSLLDFDRSGRGDVELDVATFVAEVDFVSPKSCDIAGINAKFITGFESVAGPLDPMRFGLYRAHKHVAKVLRLARSVRVDGAAKAAALLANIRTNLDEMCAKGTAKTWALVGGWKRHLGVLATTILAQVDSVTVEAYLYLECLL